MICAASNIRYGTSVIPDHPKDTMLHSEAHYSHGIVSEKHKLENLYSLNHNNNIIEGSKMPGPLLHEMDVAVGGHSGGLDEQRALQLALELSMLGLTSDEDHVFSEARVKKSMNMTECVPVPSSEHVAEIVGRQGVVRIRTPSRETSYCVLFASSNGCKIKALRAKTNTYIKTPVRGEEPVFVVTGRKEDVALAKQEILQAAEHFSQIRASRRNSSNLSPLGPPSPTAPGHVTKQVRVPYRVVGLVVGPKGSTIKRIQQATNTYIVTPSRDKEPIFEVTGLPENVDRAKREVEHHIALRTGGIIDPTHPENNEHLLNGFSSSLFSAAGGSSGSFSAFLDHNHSNHVAQHHNRDSSLHSLGYFSGSSAGSSKFSDLSSSTASPFSNNAFYYDSVVPSPTADVDSVSQFDPAPGSPSPSIWPEMGSRSSLMNRVVGSQTQSSLAAARGLNIGAYGHNGETGRASPAHLQRYLSEQVGKDMFSALQSTLGQFNGTVATSTVQSGGYGDSVSTSSIMGLSASIIDITKNIATSDGESQSSSPDWMNRGEKSAKICMVCQGGAVVAALVPCGHNLFCMECAEAVKEDGRECPACQRKVDAVLRIFT